MKQGNKSSLPWVSSLIKSLHVPISIQVTAANLSLVQLITRLYTKHLGCRKSLQALTMCRAFISPCYFLDLAVGSVKEAEMEAPAYEESQGCQATFTPSCVPC